MIRAAQVFTGCGLPPTPTPRRYGYGYGYGHGNRNGYSDRYAKDRSG